MTEAIEHPAASRPAMRGASYALGAAALFGAATPGAKILLADTSPVILSALLYLGAAVGLMVLRLAGARRDPLRREAPLRGEDFTILTIITILGGVAGPLLMLYGLTRVSALAGSLLLNLEAPFTMMLAVTAFNEYLGGRALLGAATIILGAVVIGWAPGNFHADAAGAVCIAGACLCWAVDNNLSQRLTIRDPTAIAHVKALGAGVTTTIIALVMGARLPGPSTSVAALILGALSYGLSLYLAMHALRILGAAREAAFFATAPFIGALISIVIFGRPLGVNEWLAAALMAAGAAMLLGERHSHTHAHEQLAHEHLHVHDAHHRHAHPPEISDAEPHTHPHNHVRLVHSHPHASDSHHRHSHRENSGHTD